MQSASCGAMVLPPLPGSVCIIVDANGLDGQSGTVVAVDSFLCKILLSRNTSSEGPIEHFWIDSSCLRLVDSTDSAASTLVELATQATHMSLPEACNTGTASRKRPARSPTDSNEEDDELLAIYKRGEVAKWARANSDETSYEQDASELNPGEDSTSLAQVDDAQGHADDAGSHQDSISADNSTSDSTGSQSSAELATQVTHMSIPEACNTGTASRKRPARSPTDSNEEDDELLAIYKRGEVAKWARANSDETSDEQDASKLNPGEDFTSLAQVDDAQGHADDAGSHQDSISVNNSTSESKGSQSSAEGMAAFI